MGNESSAAERRPEGSAAENVVLFPPQQALETQTFQGDPASERTEDRWETPSQPEQRSQPPRDVPETSAEWTALQPPTPGRCEDLYTWDSTQLGSSEAGAVQVPQGGMKREPQAGASLSASNPLLEGLWQFEEGRPAVLGLIPSPVPDGPSTPAPPRGSPALSPSALLDRELAEAFKECEAQMGSFHLPGPPNPPRESNQSVRLPKGSDEEHGAGMKPEDTEPGPSAADEEPPFTSFREYLTGILEARARVEAAETRREFKAPGPGSAGEGAPLALTKPLEFLEQLSGQEETNICSAPPAPERQDHLTAGERPPDPQPPTPFSQPADTGAGTDGCRNLIAGGETLPDYPQTGGAGNDKNASAASAETRVSDSWVRDERPAVSAGAQSGVRLGPDSELEPGLPAMPWTAPGLPEIKQMDAGTSCVSEKENCDSVETGARQDRSEGRGGDSEGSCESMLCSLNSPFTSRQSSSPADAMGIITGFTPPGQQPPSCSIEHFHHISDGERDRSPQDNTVGNAASPAAGEGMSSSPATQTAEFPPGLTAQEANCDITHPHPEDRDRHSERDAHEALCQEDGGTLLRDSGAADRGVSGTEPLDPPATDSPPRDLSARGSPRRDYLHTLSFSWAGGATQPSNCTVPVGPQRACDPAPCQSDFIEPSVGNDPRHAGGGAHREPLDQTEHSAGTEPPQPPPALRPPTAPASHTQPAASADGSLRAGGQSGFNQGNISVGLASSSERAPPRGAGLSLPTDSHTCSPQLPRCPDDTQQLAAGRRERERESDGEREQAVLLQRDDASGSQSVTPRRGAADAQAGETLQPDSQTAAAAECVGDGGAMLRCSGSRMTRERAAVLAVKSRPTGIVQGSSVLGSCASLPPLTIHECLRHPVSESSFSYQGLYDSGRSVLVAEDVIDSGPKQRESENEKSQAVPGSGAGDVSLNSAGGVANQVELSTTRATTAQPAKSATDGDLRSLPGATAESHVDRSTGPISVIDELQGGRSAEGAAKQKTEAVKTGGGDVNGAQSLFPASEEGAEPKQMLLSAEDRRDDTSPHHDILEKICKPDTAQAGADLVTSHLSATAAPALPAGAMCLGGDLAVPEHPPVGGTGGDVGSQSDTVPSSSPFLEIQDHRATVPPPRPPNCEDFILETETCANLTHSVPGTFPSLDGQSETLPTPIELQHSPSGAVPDRDTADRQAPRGVAAVACAPVSSADTSHSASTLEVDTVTLGRDRGVQDDALVTDSSPQESSKPPSHPTKPLEEQSLPPLPGSSLPSENGEVVCVLVCPSVPVSEGQLPPFNVPVPEDEIDGQSPVTGPAPLALEGSAATECGAGKRSAEGIASGPPLPPPSLNNQSSACELDSGEPENRHIRPADSNQTPGPDTPVSSSGVTEGAAKEKSPAGEIIINEELQNVDHSTENAEITPRPVLTDHDSLSQNQDMSPAKPLPHPACAEAHSLSTGTTQQQSSDGSDVALWSDPGLGSITDVPSDHLGFSESSSVSPVQKTPGVCPGQGAIGPKGEEDLSSQAEESKSDPQLIAERTQPPQNPLESSDAKAERASCQDLPEHTESEDVRAASRQGAVPVAQFSGSLQPTHTSQEAVKQQQDLLDPVYEPTGIYGTAGGAERNWQACKSVGAGEDIQVQPPDPESGRATPEGKETLTESVPVKLDPELKEVPQSENFLPTASNGKVPGAGDCTASVAPLDDAEEDSASVGDAGGPAGKTNGAQCASETFPERERVTDRSPTDAQLAVFRPTPAPDARGPEPVQLPPEPFCPPASESSPRQACPAETAPVEPQRGEGESPAPSDAQQDARSQQPSESLTHLGEQPSGPAGDRGGAAQSPAAPDTADRPGALESGVQAAAQPCQGPPAVAVDRLPATPSETPIPGQSREDGQDAHTQDSPHTERTDPSGSARAPASTPAIELRPPSSGAPTTSCLAAPPEAPQECGPLSPLQDRRPAPAQRCLGSSDSEKRDPPPVPRVPEEPPTIPAPPPPADLVETPSLPDETPALPAARVDNCKDDSPSPVLTPHPPPPDEQCVELPPYPELTPSVSALHTQPGSQLPLCLPIWTLETSTEALPLCLSPPLPPLAPDLTEAAPGLSLLAQESSPQLPLSAPLIAESGTKLPLCPTVLSPESINTLTSLPQDLPPCLLEDSQETSLEVPSCPPALSPQLRLPPGVPLLKEASSKEVPPVSVETQEPSAQPALILSGLHSEPAEQLPPSTELSTCPPVLPPEPSSAVPHLSPSAPEHPKDLPPSLLLGAPEPSQEKYLSAPFLTVEPSETHSAPVLTLEPAEALSAPVLTLETAETFSAPVLTLEPAETLSAPVQTLKPAEALSAQVPTLEPAEALSAPFLTVEPSETHSAPVLTLEPAEALSAPVLTLETAEAFSAPVPTLEPAEALSAPFLTVEPSEIHSVPVQTLKPAEALSAPVLTLKPAETLSAPVQTLEPAEALSAPVLTLETAETLSVPVLTLEPAEVLSAPVLTLEPAETLSVPVQTLKPAEALSAPVLTLEPAEALSAPVQTLEPAEALSAPVQTLEPAEALSAPVPTLEPAEALSASVPPLETEPAVPLLSRPESETPADAHPSVQEQPPSPQLPHLTAPERAPRLPVLNTDFCPSLCVLPRDPSAEELPRDLLRENTEPVKEPIPAPPTGSAEHPACLSVLTLEPILEPLPCRSVLTQEPTPEPLPSLFIQTPEPTTPEPLLTPEPTLEPLPCLSLLNPEPTLEPPPCQSVPTPEPTTPEPLPCLSVLTPESTPEPPTCLSVLNPEPTTPEPLPCLSVLTQESSSKPRPVSPPAPQHPAEHSSLLSCVSGPPPEPNPGLTSWPPESCADPPSAFIRSSDSEGAFETPESTTPVKAAPPPLVPEPEPQPSLPSEDTGFCSDSASAPDVSLSEPLSEPPLRPVCRSLSTVFDEDKPIASSGAYNLELLEAVDSFHASADHGTPEQPGSERPAPSRRRSTDSVPAARCPLTRSLSLQAGELEGSGKEDGAAASEKQQLRAEAFSIGTESAPGTLRKAKKARPASLKKKLSLKQKPDSPRPESPPQDSASPDPDSEGSGTKRTAAQPESPAQSQEEEATLPASASPEPAVRRKTGVKKPKPPAYLEPEAPTSKAADRGAAEETGPPEEAPLPASPPHADEDSPIPPKASYNWDPDNFESINPFCTGGSKVPNSPVCSRKSVAFTAAPEPLELPSEPAPPPDSTPAEEQPLNKRQSVRLEFDYSEERESGEPPREVTPPPKKLGKKPGAKMPLRKPKIGVRKPPPAEQLDNTPSAPPPPVDCDEIPIPKASYNFDPSQWDDPNFNPFSSSSAIPNSPRLPQVSYSFDPDAFDDSVDPFKPSNKMGNSPPKNSASFEVPANDNETNGIEDANQNKTGKKKKPLKTNTFRVKKSPKRSPLSEPSSQDATPLATPEAPPVIPSEDHATDEEKLASSSNQKWTFQGRHLAPECQDYPQPSDLSAFVNETSFPSPSDVTEYEIEYMEKIGSSSPPLSSGKKPSLYLKLDSVQESPSKSLCVRGSEPSTPCSGLSFEEVEAQLSSGMKSPLSSSRVLEPPAAECSRKIESEAPSPGMASDREDGSLSQEQTDLETPLLERLSLHSEPSMPLHYLEPDLAETNPAIFAQKLQCVSLMAVLCLSLQPREILSPADSVVSKSSLYSRTGYSEGEGSPFNVRDLDHSLGIAREEIVAKEKEVAEWQRKYEESRQEVVEMRRIVAEYEKTIAQMIEDEQREKSLSHHTIQQLIVEKEQALADLNSVEKSLADLFRRYEKMKDVLDGFRKNEEVLKKCAQEYLTRVRKEEQRYQALKIHAEEKLDKANSDIAQVRAKAKQEQAAYQASLRKEQMRVESLERTLEQKNKEIEELTKICDELISKMGRS
ncbi:transforming acidic coiled-coil-containing protein 2 isoform X3 [Amia ocellicauda]|uniref:transforming acidic coiled-coil-containing protein 2 isoform X3 n=1 Tax=Amia ocellicauda TaxID=2972642 RepID=UPI003464028A